MGRSEPNSNRSTGEHTAADHSRRSWRRLDFLGAVPLQSTATANIMVQGRAGAWRRSVGREHQLFCPRCPVRTEVPTTERHDNLGGGGHLSVWVNLLGYRGFRRVSRAGDGQGDVLRMRSSCLGGGPTTMRWAPVEVTEARGQNRASGVDLTAAAPSGVEALAAPPPVGNSKEEGFASVGVVLNRGRGVVDLNIAGRLADSSRAARAAGLPSSGSGRGHRCSGDRYRRHASRQQRCDVVQFESPGAPL
jgi:hypothetical protein